MIHNNSSPSLDEWVSINDVNNDDDDYIVKDNKNGLLSGIVSIINCFLLDLKHQPPDTCYKKDLWHCINNKNCQNLILNWNVEFGGSNNINDGLKLKTIMKFAREMLLVQSKVLNPYDFENKKLMPKNCKQVIDYLVQTLKQKESVLLYGYNAFGPASNAFNGDFMGYHYIDEMNGYFSNSFGTKFNIDFNVSDSMLESYSNLLCPLCLGNITKNKIVIDDISKVFNTTTAGFELRHLIFDIRNKKKYNNRLSFRDRLLAGVDIVGFKRKPARNMRVRNMSKEKKAKVRAFLVAVDQAGKKLFI